MQPDISVLIRCSAVFLPTDPAGPARHGRIAFWSRDGELTDAIRPIGSPGPLGAPAPAGPAGPPGSPWPPWSLETLSVVVADGPEPAAVTVTALVLPVADALPLLVRARLAVAASGAATSGAPASGTTASAAAAFWGAAGLLALRFLADGLLLPGLTTAAYDAWRIGPLDQGDHDRVRELAAAMPPEAHCVPLTTTGPLLLPAPEPLLRVFLDAVADTLPRSPAAAAATAGPVFAAPAAERHPELRPWADEIAAAHDAAVRISLRVELTASPDRPTRPAGGPTGDPTSAPDAEPGAGPGCRAVLQMHGLGGAALVADAADVWSGAGPAATGFPPRARRDALRALRRAARAWPPLAPLLTAAVPDAVPLADEEVAELLGPAATALAADGVQVHWPRGLARTLDPRAVIDSGSGAALTGPLSGAAPLSLAWRHSLGGHGDLTAEELDRLAEAKRPLVRLRDQWVLIDPAEARRARARARQERAVAPLDALIAVLTGSTELDGRRVDVTATGSLERLRALLSADPEHPGAPGSPDAQVVTAPPELRATLRDYQLRGLRWLVRMTELGLGGCLADDMGLGKTITLIALHLHRQRDPGTAGATLVVCPASLLGNWQREIERFAPGTPVHRFHGARRSLDGPAGGSFVLTTYATMRAAAPELASADWGMVVADEAQHVKNPHSATAKALRTIGAPARVALTGTPVENNLTDLWAVLNWTTPGLLGRLGTFRARFGEDVESGRDPLAADRLASLVRPFLLRRRKSDPGIAPELPPKTETDHAVTLSAEQAGLYEAVVRETLAAIAAADGMERRGLVVKLLTSLKQICNHPAQYLKEGGGRSGKLDLLDELLDTIVSEGGSVLVFTQYVAMARILERHLAARGIPAQLLHGGTPVARREELVDRFQDGEVPVFLLSLKAAGTGLNLTRAGHVVHYDRWWNPAVEEQATDRAYRIGQTQPVQVHRIIAEGTVEDRIGQLLSRKKALADAVLGAGEAAFTELSDADLAALVALRGPDDSAATDRKERA
ncbi:DEAD/DEAH box helicase [Streptomyces sp. NPDC051555]|uniref:DEAD/DEAH box helicase n=1 Tax=Streptomyces sp. NPDC051555 TaxID=3365657 RepID=UPI0037A7C74C